MLLAHPFALQVPSSRSGPKMSSSSSTSSSNVSGKSDVDAVTPNTPSTSKPTSSSGGRHTAPRVKRMFPTGKGPLGPSGLIPGRVSKSEESPRSRGFDADNNTSPPDTRNALRLQPLLSTAVLRSSEPNSSDISADIPISLPPPLPPKHSRLHGSKSQDFVTASRRSNESSPTSSLSDPPPLGNHVTVGNHTEITFQFPRPSIKPGSPSPSPLSTLSRPAASSLASRSRLERHQGDVAPDSIQFISISSAEQGHYERDSSSPLPPISESPNIGRPGLPQRRSISLTNLTETFKLSKGTEQDSVPSGGAKFPTLGPSKTSLSRNGGLPSAPTDDILPPKGHPKGRVAIWSAAAGSSPPAPASTTSRHPRVNAVSFAHRRFDSTPIRDRAASASSIPVIPSRQSISGNIGTTPGYPPRQAHHHHNLSALGAAGGIARDLGRKGWDKVERLWSSSNNSSPPRLGTSPHDGGGEGGRDGKSKSHNSDSSSPFGHDDGRTFSPAKDSGVSLPRCVRPPSSNSGGLLFGRNLSDAVAATKITNNGAPWLDEKGSLRDAECPALVVRCIQHLELWGVQEEGIFRITGRSTHAAKLRSEFDSGADYDLRQASPSDLDPHSVSSVFKAFFRELPEPILTLALARAFEDVLVDKNDSLEGSSGSLQASADTLIADLRRLLARLPVENWFLLRELCRLLKVTAAHQKTTKMPLSNLVLVFCPSLSMNPSLLRLLVEVQEDIFVESASSRTSREETLLLNPAPRRNSIIRQPSSTDLKLAHAISSANSITPSSLPPTAPVVRQSPSLTRLNNVNGARGNRPKHMHNISLPLLTRSNSLIRSNPSPEPVSSQASTPLSSEEHLTRPRTPASLRAFGALLGSRSRSNTNPSVSPVSPETLSPDSRSRVTSAGVAAEDGTDADRSDRSRRYSQTLPKISLHIPGGGTGIFFPLGSPGSGSRRTSWSDPVLPLPPTVDLTTATTSPMTYSTTGATPIADLFRAVSEGASSGGGNPQAATDPSHVLAGIGGGAARSKGVDAGSRGAAQSPPPQISLTELEKGTSGTGVSASGDEDDWAASVLIAARV